MSSPPHVVPRRILVIEDNFDAAESLRDALDMSGHQVQIAHEGRRALDLARQFVPEVVLCDIGLPGMDGLAIARAFRADPALRSAHLVALSGHALPEDRRRSALAGFDRHLGKPVDLENLEQVLAEIPSTPGAGR
jgi:two-component system CheB/CheR fusion protein